MALCGKIHDRKAAKPESYAGTGVDPNSLVIRSAVYDRVTHALRDALKFVVPKGFAGEDSGQAAHFDSPMLWGWSSKK
jgi:hypothetical protein